MKLASVLKEKILWMQIVGATGSILLMFMSGAIGGWTSPLLARLTAEDSPIPITLDEASWVASLMNLGRLLGAVPAAVSVYYLGSKRTLLLNGIPVILSWVSFVVADSVWWLYIGRLLAGFSIGITYASFPLYLGEVSNPAVRGALVTFASLGVSIGTLFGNVFGAYVSLTDFGYICLVPSVIAILIFIWVPESPHYLIGIGKVEEARKAIARYNPNTDVEVEAKSIEEFVNASKSISFKDKLREFNVPANRKAGLIIIVLHMFTQLSGLNSIFYYMEIILTEAELTLISPSTMVMITGVGGIVGGVAAIYLIDKLGRKMLWFYSTLGLALTMILLGTHFTLLYSGFDSANLQWFLISIIIAYVILVFIGIFPIPNTILSELFAPDIKGIASCAASISLGVFSFISTRTYQPLLDATSEAVIFWIYATTAGLAMLFGIFGLLETKGKSLQEIQDTLHKKKSSVNRITSLPKRQYFS